MPLTWSPYQNPYTLKGTLKGTLEGTLKGTVEGTLKGTLNPDRALGLRMLAALPGVSSDGCEAGSSTFQILPSANPRNILESSLSSKLLLVRAQVSTIKHHKASIERNLGGTGKRTLKP